MLFCIAFLFQFLVAGLTGIMLAAAPFNWQLGRLVFRRRAFPLRDRRRHPLHACSPAFYYWFPKVTGRMLQRAARAAGTSGCSSSASI